MPIIARILAALTLGLVIPAHALAAPYIPARDDVVLAVLPQSASLVALRALEQQHRATPDDRATSLALVRAYIALGKREGDPRYYGYAEAITTPLLAVKTTKPDLELMLVQAIILQHRHDFDGAQVLLNKILREKPRYIEALLVRAVIAMARGDYNAARADCAMSLTPATGALLGITCRSMVDGASGKLAESYATLNRFYTQFATQASADEASWALSTLGDMARRLGDEMAAQKHFRAALVANPYDYYAMAALADLLLDAKRPDEVMPLLGDFTNQDHLLLRIALAEKQRGGSGVSDLVDELRARIVANRARNETTHLRDDARFYLDLADEPRTAYRLAKENWKKAKEPEDARILIRAAIAVGEPATVNAVRAWQRSVGYEDITFTRYDTP